MEESSENEFFRGENNRYFPRGKLATSSLQESAIVQSAAVSKQQRNTFSFCFICSQSSFNVIIGEKIFLLFIVCKIFRLLSKALPKWKAAARDSDCESCVRDENVLWAQSGVAPAECIVFSISERSHFKIVHLWVNMEEIHTSASENRLDSYSRWRNY